MKIRTGEIADKDKDKKIVSSVKLSKGTRVGTLKLTVNGDEQDNVLIRGLGGGSSTVIGGSVDTQALWDAINKKVDIDFFKNLFTVYDSSDLEITTNTYTQIPDNLRISVGTWTDEYLSALGRNSDSGGGGGGTGTVTGIAVGVGSDPIYPDYATGIVTIPAYPTRVSQLVNDSNYITASYVNNSFYTRAEADSKFMTIAAFENLFNVFSLDGTRLHHPYSSGVDNIKALVGLWTEQYLSALGLNSTGGGGGGGGGSVDVIKVDGVSYTSDQNGVADITNAFTNYAYISGNTIHIGGTTYSYSYNLPTASQSTLGGVKVGNSLIISDGVLNIPTQQGIVSGSSYTKVTVDAYGRITAGENPTTLAGYGITDAYTKTQVDDQFLSKAFFKKLFQAHNGNANVNPVNPTTDASASVDNIEAMFGFWTEQYISALGNNSQSGTAGSVTSVKVAANTYIDPVEGIIDLSNYVTTSAQRTSWDNKLTNVLYSSKRLQRTVNGTTTNIVTASTLFNDGLPTNTPRNYVLASPADTAGTPEFRALDEADIPDIPISKVTSLQTTLNSKADSSVVITAGNGLTGGGSLTGNIDINVASANAAITVNADNIKLNVINDYTTTANNTIIPLAAARGKDLNDRLAILESWFEEDANGDIKTKNRPNGGSPRGFYTESFVSALGANSQGGGSSSFDEEQMWIALDATDEVIGTSHIPDIASTYGYLKASDLSGYINNISVAGTGNAITAASKSGSTITFTKGNTFLTGVTLTGDVTGSGTTSIATTISNGAVTNAMLAGSIANNKLANSAITINNTSVSLGGTFSTASITAGTIGQSTTSSGYTIAVPYVTVNSYGIVTGYGTHTHTVNSIPNSSLANSSVTVNGTSVSLGDSVTTTKWGTSRNISIQDSDGTNTGNAVSVDGSAAATLKLPATIKASLTGNASTATTLQTARNIWGQSFNGSADIKGDLFLLSTASGTNINTPSAKLKFNSLYDDDTTVYRSPYIQGVGGQSYGRKRLGFFQSNATNYTDDFVEVFSIYPTGLVYIPSTGSFKIGDCTITWDSTNNMLKFDKGIYSTGAVSALGSNSSGGGGGSGDFDEDQMWTALQANSGTYANTKINWNHIPVATASAIGGIKVGTTLAISSGVLNQKSGIVTANTYRSVTVDTYGRVTAGTNPTTLSGYGITDAKIASGTITLGSNTITPLTSSSSLAWGKLTGTPTTLSGYGITNAYTKTQVDNALGGYLPLSGGTMTGSITFPNASAAYNSAGVKWAGGSMIGESTAGGLGIYSSTDKVYIRPNVDNDGYTNGVVVASDAVSIYRTFTTTSADDVEYAPARLFFITKDTRTGFSYTAARIAAYHTQTTTATNGVNMVITPGGNLFVGGGESAMNLYALYKGSTTEHLYLTGDSQIYVEAAANTIADRRGFIVTSGGHVVPCRAEETSDNTANLGASGTRWANVYATTFHGALDGNATTATSATSATTASKLSTVSKTAWGQTYWTSGGIPTNISGNMTGVGSITANGDYVSTRTNATNTFVTVANSIGSVGIRASNPNRGLVDETNNVWIIATNGTNTWLNQGKVGIGTSSPTQKLDVEGNIIASGYVAVGTGGANSYLASDSATNIYLKNSSGAVLVCDGKVVRRSTSSSMADVTLGSSTYPWGGLYSTTGDFSSTLSVTGASTLTGNITAGGHIYMNNGKSIYIKNSSSTNENIIGMNSSNQFLVGYGHRTSGSTILYGLSVTLSTNGTSRLYVLSNGNVGIANSSPSEKLHVTGNILASGEVTASSDERKKNIISNTKFNVKDIASARSILYEWNDDRDKDNEKKIHGGSIAQDWLGKADSFLNQDNDGWYSINYGALALCSAITIARMTINHEDRITLLEKENAKLKARVAELEERRA